MLRQTLGISVWTTVPKDEGRDWKDKHTGVHTQARQTPILSIGAGECVWFQPHPTNKSDGPLSCSVLVEMEQWEKHPKAVSHLTKLTDKWLITYTERIFSDEKIAELQHPLKCAQIVKTNSKKFSVKEKWSKGEFKKLWGNLKGWQRGLCTVNQF